jgi:iron complex transport system substrate-binding protein
MTGHPMPRRNPARPGLPPSRQPRLHLLLLAVLLALALTVSAGLLVAGCASGTATTTTAAPSSTTASTAAAETTTTAASAASAETTTSVASQPAGSVTYPVTLTDDSGNSVTIKTKPVRIVSTAPASTEILFALGLGDRVVGVTSLDDYPPEAAKIAKIGEYQPNAEAIMALSPDLVLAYSENEEALAPIKAAGAPVVIFNATSFDQIYADIALVGQAADATQKATEVVDSIKAQVKAVADAAAKSTFSPKVFYAVDNTLWTAGPGSFVDAMLKLVGATNVGAMQGGDSAAAQAYFQFTPEQLIAADPDIILLPNTAYKSIDEFVNDPRFAEMSAVQAKHVYLVNDVIITRPGPRIGDGLKALFDAVQAGSN